MVYVRGRLGRQLFYHFYHMPSWLVGHCADPFAASEECASIRRDSVDGDSNLDSVRAHHDLQSHPCQAKASTPAPAQMSQPKTARPLYNPHRGISNKEEEGKDKMTPSIAGEYIGMWDPIFEGLTLN